MEAILRGTRGGVPAPGPSTTRFGGNTTALQITTAVGTTVVLGAGTGILTMGRGEDAPQGELAIMVSHLHWDDIQGLPFFEPLFDPARVITIFGPRPTPEMSLRDGLQVQMRPPHFSVTLEDVVAADLRFVEVDPGSPFSMGILRVTPFLTAHPGLTLAYRLDEADTGHSLAFAPENELPQMSSARVAEMAMWAQGVDVLVHDAQYTEDEYPAKRGWGHSTHASAMGLARAANARSLAFTHHDPGRSDDELEAVTDRAVLRDEARHPGDPLSAFPAAEGAVLRF